MDSPARLEGRRDPQIGSSPRLGTGIKLEVMCPSCGFFGGVFTFFFRIPYMLTATAEPASRAGIIY